MIEQCKFNNSTKEYLTNFYCILDKMIKNMTSVVLSQSISQNFIMQMIPHHRAAIEMSHNILRYTSNSTLQSIASDIVTMQMQSIENMQNIESQCSTFYNSYQDLCLYQRHFQKITQTMFSQMNNAYANNNINTDFIREMIPHHRGAILMSENTLRYDICPELKPIIDAIITSQQEGIQKMNQLLRCIN